MSVIGRKLGLDYLNQNYLLFCDKFGVRGYPTLKVLSPPDTEGEAYEGGRDLAALKKFAAGLGPGCSVDAPENCSDEQKVELEKFVSMPTEEREALKKTLKASLSDAEAAHDDLLKKLQAQFKESQDGIEKLKSETSPKIKMLNAATPATKASSAGKDEM